MSEDVEAQGERPRWIFAARLALGMVQGLALYLLYSAVDAHGWPATAPLLFGPLLVIFLFLPPLAAQALGGMRVRTLVLWMLAAAVMLAVLAAYDVWSAWPQDYVVTYHQGRPDDGDWLVHVMPSVAFFFSAAAALFIAHALVAGGDADRRFMARYTTHYDVAWKLAVQAGLSAVFVAVFWLLLEMGAGLFALIKLDFFRHLIEHDWFAIPATALAAVSAIHLTDVRAGLVRGARTLMLLLLSWLLPLTTLIVTAFLASLVFTGLDPLWKIGHASALLLVASAVLIVLINAAHQDGAPERAPPGILRISGSIASVALIPLVALAARALLLRVAQYGWTTDRVLTAACVLIAATYAVGYVIAATPSGAWLKRIETWNFCVALLILAVFVALATPVASPVRISVADQMARRNAQMFRTGKFDFVYLRWEGGRYGREALLTLAEDKDPAIAAEARHYLAATVRYTDFYQNTTPAPSATLARRILVYPAGQKLPQAFLATDWSAQSAAYEMPNCITSADEQCDGTQIDLDGDGTNEIVLFDRDSTMAYVFRDQGGWRLAGAFVYSPDCGDVRARLRKGPLQAVAPERRWSDIMLGGERLHVGPPTILAPAASCNR